MESVNFRARVRKYELRDSFYEITIPKLVGDNLGLVHREVVDIKLIRTEKKDDPAPKSEQPPVASTPL